jgi:hypothetical protein
MYLSPNIAQNSRRITRRSTSFVLTLLLACAAFLALVPSASASWSTGSFSYDLTVSKPLGVSPNDDSGAITFDYPSDPIELTWYPVGGATSYQVQVATGADFDEPDVVIDTTVTKAAYVPSMSASDGSSGLFQSGTYYWRVRAVNGSTNGVWSGGESFARTWTSTPTNLDFHDDDGTVTSTTSLAGYLTWDAVPGAASYDVQMASAQSFSSDYLVLSASALKSTSAIIPELPDDTYSWRVRARDANGAVGSWAVASDAITKSWATIDPASAFPADNTLTGDLRIGWDPVPGASYYQVQVASSSSCFSNWATMDGYATWDPTNPPSSTTPYCRLSESDCTTINNWETGLAGNCMFAEDVLEAIQEGLTDPFPSQFYWRVRPVTVLSSATETSWGVTSTQTIYGDWLVRTAPVLPYKVRVNSTPAPSDDGSTNCSDSSSVAVPACLVQTDSYMKGSSATEHDSTSMQMPVLDWEPYLGSAGGGALVGGYLLEIDSDPLFHTQVYTAQVGGYGYGWTTSFAMESGLPDNQQGTGYWWRVIPCEAALIPPDNHISGCNSMYFPGITTAKFFSKRVDFTGDLSVVNNFAGAMPKLQWSRVDSADHYEIELARDQFFDSSGTIITHKTGVRMLIPFSGSGSSLTELDEGTWYWRVRAVDRNGLATGWSDTSSFVKRIPGPTLTSPTDGATVTTPIVSWNPVDSAESYEVQYSASTGFSSATTQTTSQTAIQLTAYQGTWYWRVRAVSGSQKGAWATYRTITVVNDDTLQYALSRTALNANDPLYINGYLTVDGAAPSSAQTVSLQKNAGCARTYVTVDSKLTGSAGEQGTVRFKRTAGQIDCYRMKYTDTGGLPHYSAPFRALVRPKVTAKLNYKKIRRGRTVKVTVKLNKAVTGRAIFQIYKRKVWTNVKTVNVRNKRAFTIKAKVNSAGTFKTRLKLDNMRAYTTTVKATTSLRVNDAFTISRRR